MRLVLVSSCVSCLLVVLRGRVFSFRRSFVVRSSFSRRLRVRLRSIVPASRFLRLVCACRVIGAIALMGYEMRNRVVSWGRGMIGNGVRLFVVLVLLACPPFARRDTIVEAATPPPACLLAGVFFSIWGWMGERGEDGEAAVRMMRQARPGIIAATAERGNKAPPTLRGRLRYPSRRLLAVDERMRRRRSHGNATRVGETTRRPPHG